MLRTKQRLYRTTFVHRPVPFSDLVKRQRQIEHFPRVDLLVEHKVDQFREESADRRWATVQMHLGVEQLGPVEFNPVRNANVTHEPARTCGTDGLHHVFLRANALQYGISPDSFRQLFDSRDSFITAFGYDVGGTELAREFLPRAVAAH